MEYEYTSLRLIAAGKTHPGKRRSLNEDAWRIAVPDDETAHLWPGRGRLFAVADGMGGHAAGEVASQLAVKVLFDEYYGDDDVFLPPRMRLEQAVLNANRKIYEQAQAQSSQAGMGTTIVAAVVRDDWLIVANVGDSRAYLVRDGRAMQITRDHSWVAEQVEAGVLTEEEAHNHIYRNVVTRCLGHHLDVQVDTFEEQLMPGDVVLLCSDGLSNQVSNAEIAHILSQEPPEQAVETLIDLANRYGGPDNITAVVFKAIPRETRTEPMGQERLPVSHPAQAAQPAQEGEAPGRVWKAAKRIPWYAKVAVIVALVLAATGAFAFGVILATLGQGVLRNISATSTFTPMPTITSTVPPIITPTATPFPTPTATYTSTPTSTSTPTPTATPTATLTPTVTSTATPAPTATFTPTPTPLPTSGPQIF